MAYHESFWLATAAAAPVIALANTVAIADVVSLWFNSPVRKRSSLSKFSYFIIIFGSGGNLLIQAIILYVALRNLLAGADIGLAAPVIYLVVFGLIYLLLILIMNIALRYLLRDDEAEEKKGEVGAKKANSLQANEVAAGLGWPTSPPSSR